jgi:hypothetical protein
MEEERGDYEVMLRKHEEKRTFGRPRRRWEDNIEIHLQTVGWGVE